MYPDWKSKGWCVNLSLGKSKDKNVLSKKFFDNFLQDLAVVNNGGAPEMQKKTDLAHKHIKIQDDSLRPYNLECL